MDINDFLKWFGTVAKDFYVDDFGFIRKEIKPYRKLCYCPLQVLFNRDGGYVKISIDHGLDPYFIMAASDCPASIRDKNILRLRKQMLEMIHADTQKS